MSCQYSAAGGLEKNVGDGTPSSAEELTAEELTAQDSCNVLHAFICNLICSSPNDCNSIRAANIYWQSRSCFRNVLVVGGGIETILLNECQSGFWVSLIPGTAFFCCSTPVIKTHTPLGRMSLRLQLLFFFSATNIAQTPSEVCVNYGKLSTKCFPNPPFSLRAPARPPP